MNQKEIMNNKEHRIFNGNILLFYAFDVGDEIDLDTVRKKELLPIRSTVVSPYFKDYHIPLSFQMPPDAAGFMQETDCIMSKLHHFGVLSFCYRVPFTATFDELKPRLIHVHEQYEKKAEHDAQVVFNAIARTVRKPKFYQLKHSYYVVHVNPFTGMSANEFKQEYAQQIAAMLRLEVQNLADYQCDAILASTIGYFGEDFIVIDSEASFVFDDEYFETLEFFEMANIQVLELQYFDRVLYNKLNFFYSQEKISVPWKAYVPLIESWVESPVTQLAKLRVDVSVITEQLENNIKMVGDAYFSQLYMMLIDKLTLRGWMETINKKLEIMKDIYSIYQNRLLAIREEMLTLVIIVLIAVEVFVAFMR